MANKKDSKASRQDVLCKVLACILQNRTISRIEIADRCALSPSVVTNVVGQLLADGAIEEVCAGESTGGRKPILLQVKQDYGSLVTFEITRMGVCAKLYDLGAKLKATLPLSDKFLTGNGLMQAIARTMEQVNAGEVAGVSHIVGAGLLCQDDIPEYDLTVSFSTSLSTDVIRLETAISTRWNIPVKKEFLNRFSLHSYLEHMDVKCANYAYIDLGKRVTASFVLDHHLVRSANDSVFDLSSAVLCGNYAGAEATPSFLFNMAQQASLRRLTPKQLAEQLTKVVNSALLFFPVENVFIGGAAESLDQIVQDMANHFHVLPVIRKADFTNTDTSNIFARQILSENPGALLPQI